jgi:hypothetical protein
MLSKLLSPAAEAFRYFVLEHGEDYLAQHFARHIRLPPAVESNKAAESR